MAKKKIKRREAGSVRNALMEVFPGLSISTLYSTGDLAEISDHKRSSVASTMKSIHAEQGIARVQLDKDYWMRPSMDGRDTEVYSGRAMKTREELEHWHFIVYSLDMQGYCESPGILRHAHNKARGRIERDRYEIEWLSRTHDRFRDYSTDGDGVFDTFVGMLDLPTADLYGMKAIVYHPGKMIKAQELVIE